MTLRKSIITVLVLCTFLSVGAQKFELGRVTISELQEREYSQEPSAAAAILFKKGEVHIEYSQLQGFLMKTEVKAKIKIYKKEGFEWANNQIQYYLFGDWSEKISIVGAATYNLVDGKIVKTKLKNDGEFDEKNNKYWGTKKITLPNVKEGSIIEFDYVITCKRFGKLPDWDFQTSIPVKYSEFKTYIPEYFIFNPSQKGFLFPKITVEKIPASIIITTKDRSVGRVSETNFSSDKLEYVETRTTYIAENMPAMKEESYVNNIKNYTSSVSHELSIINYPNVPLKTFSTDWETVTKTIYKDDDFGPELNKTGYFEADVTSLIAGLKSRDEIIIAILGYVKSIKWNDYYGYSCGDGVKKAYKDKIGNVAEINLMLIAMLRYAGINANPVLLSTRSHGIALFPNLTAFNYVIGAVETEGEPILLDATEKYSSPGVLPLRDLNWFGRLIRKDGSSSQINLMPQGFSKEINYMNLVLKNDGSIDGKIRKQLTEHKALDYRQQNLSRNKDSYVEDLEYRNNAIEINDYMRDNDLDLTKPIAETYSFKNNKDLEIIENKMYLSPLLFLTFKENPFRQEKREYPIDFGYPSQSKFNINIEIPKGYAIESIPKPLNLVTGNNIGAFKYNIATNDNKIQLTITTDINTPIVPADDYEVLKDFYQKMMDKQNEKIVLIKSE
ncbi:MAG: DUF3857 and transglutaminase domain-containing protein [Burkholderiales bacterium]|nr:DUF3857 and transglutaminase domain-containing protein [Flavobacterium sp.]